MLTSRFSAGIRYTFDAKVVNRLFYYRNNLVDRHNMARNKRLVIRITTLVTMNIATLKPYTQSFVRTFRFRTTVYTRNVKLNHCQNQIQARFSLFLLRFSSLSSTAILLCFQT